MFSLKEESRRTKIILISVTVIFILLGIYATFKFGNDTLLGSLEAPDNDDVKFIRSGWNLYERGYYSYHYPENKSAFMMPGLPIVIAGCTAIFGKMGAITAVRIIQVLLQAVSLLLVFFIARKIFNNSIVSLLAFILNAIYLPNLWASQLILTETIFKTLLLLLIYVTMYAIETKKVFYYIIGGILLGVSSYFRPQVALLPVLVLIMWIINKKYTFFDMVKFASIVIVIFVAIMAPWWIRNYVVFDKVILFTYATGNPMLQGTYINYDQSVKYTTDIEYGIDHDKFPYYERDEFKNNETEVALSKERFWKVLKNEPLRYIGWYTIGKTTHNWIKPFYWVEIYNINLNIVFVYHWILLIFAVAGFIFYLYKRGRNLNFLFISMIILYFNCVYLPFYAFSRYMYPVTSLMIILSAYGIYTVYELIRYGYFDKNNMGI